MRLKTSEELIADIEKRMQDLRDSSNAKMSDLKLQLEIARTGFIIGDTLVHRYKDPETPIRHFFITGFKYDDYGMRNGFRGVETIEDQLLEIPDHWEKVEDSDIKTA